MPRKRISNKDLHKGILGLNEKFVGLNEKFLGLNENFSDLNGKFVDLNEKFVSLNENFVGLNEKVAGIDEKILHIDKKILHLDEKILANQTLLEEVVSALHIFATNVDQRFEKVDERFEKVDERFEHMESQMVTKQYLDDKLADIRGDLVFAVKVEDKKVNKLVKTLDRRKVISQAETKDILKLEPFV